MAPRLRLHTFGGLAARADGRPVSGAAAQPRRLAVLAVLARSGDRGATREKLLALLWPDADEQRGPRTLAQALYALRRDLGGDDAIVGLRELRLDPAVVATDVGDFAAATADGAYELAADLYTGPFLDGFHLPGAPEFERWVEEERRVLARAYEDVLERLARRADARHDAAAAPGWWRKLASLDPLNARYAVGLMEALASAGDRSGALRHARVYEVLVEQHLDLPPDREVVALAERLRLDAEAPALTATLAPPPPTEPPPIPVPVNIALYPAPAPAPADAVRAPVVSPPTPRRYRNVLAGAVGAVLLAAVALLAPRPRSAAEPARVVPAAPAADQPVVAIGRIVSYRLDSTGAALAAPVADLLATNLARAPRVRVVSTARLYELLGGRDSSAGAFAGAARRAGATELVDGTLYVRPGGLLRLDLRRTDLASGDLRTTHTVEGRDVFALVDSGTARLVASLGGAAPAGSVADVTTRSVVAYRLYAEGLARQATLDAGGAARLFAAALDEDSTFAMAAFGLARNVGDARRSLELFDRARRLSANASDRERLMIGAGWAFHMSSPSLGAVAETLAVRYPDEVEGHLYRGLALVAAQEFIAAVPYLERVVAMDSVAVGRRPRCAACDALQSLVFVYTELDSLDAAEREARRWTRLQPSSAPAWFTLAGALDARGKSAEALDALRQATAVDPAIAESSAEALAMHHVLVGDYAAAERLLLARRESGTPENGASASWYLALGLRQQGRMREALASARRSRTVRGSALPAGAAPTESLLEAQILMETGRWRESAALFDSIGSARLPGAEASAVGRQRAWTLTHAAGALAAGGDTARLAAIADSVALDGAASFLDRDHKLFHHVRGLLFAARGRDAEAADELRQAMGTLVGYTRTNLELARVLLRLGRARDAVAVLQPALHGGLEGSWLYVSRTELHETLARAWDGAGRRDSAAAHWAVVARDWVPGDPPFAARAAAARARLR